MTLHALFTCVLYTVSPLDFEAVNEAVAFAPCETQRCVNVSIVDDLISEPEETFSLSLTRSSSSPFISFGLTTGQVIITDDDGKGFLFLVNYFSWRIWQHQSHRVGYVLYPQISQQELASSQ